MTIDIRDLSFSYPEKSVLRGIHLVVADAHIVCVVGPNGSGKSTLIKCIETLIRPAGGRVLLDGIDAKTFSRREIATRLGYVPQSTNQLYSTSVFDTVLMGRKPGGRPGEDDIDAVIDLLVRMDLVDIALRDYNHLSGGQQQRVLIARAMAQEPGALLFDEPTSSLDIAHQLEVMDIVRSEVNDRRISAVIVIHDLNLAARFADRIAILHEGIVYAEGPPADVLTERAIAEVYGVEADVSSRNGVVSVLPLRPCGTQWTGVGPVDSDVSCVTVGS